MVINLAAWALQSDDDGMSLQCRRCTYYLEFPSCWHETRAVTLAEIVMAAGHHVCHTTEPDWHNSWQPGGPR